MQYYLLMYHLCIALLCMFLLNNQSHHLKSTKFCYCIIILFFSFQFLYPSSLQLVLRGSTELPKMTSICFEYFLMPLGSCLPNKNIVCPPKNCHLFSLLKNKYLLSVQHCTTCRKTMNHRKEQYTMMILDISSVLNHN